MHSMRESGFFNYAHLPEGPLREASKAASELAAFWDELLPDGPEKTVAMRKLLEGKDCAVRAVGSPTWRKPAEAPSP